MTARELARIQSFPDDFIFEGSSIQIQQQIGNVCKAYHCDAIDMVQKIDYVDVVYMDPPYPSTMNNYDAFYGAYDEMFEKKSNT